MPHRLISWQPNSPLAADKDVSLPVPALHFDKLAHSCVQYVIWSVRLEIDHKLVVAADKLTHTIRRVDSTVL